MDADLPKNENTIIANAETATKTEKKPKAWLVMLILGIIGLLGGAGCVAAVFLVPTEEAPELEFPEIPSKRVSNKIYSNLTGLEIADAAANGAPTYCVQIPNGLDGARPQAGMNEAGVVFEAIAEAGITRFATIFQNPQSAVIGPIRSLRLYYLQWDTPFDCTIVHAGGADDALAAVRDGGYKDLSENYSYMYREYRANRAWNNLFTTGGLLGQMNSDWGFGGSNVQGFKRLTPEESLIQRVDDSVAERLVITKPTTNNTSELVAKVPRVAINFSSADFNVVYNYNAATNSYDRSYASGYPHENYACPMENLGEVAPEARCELRQLSPSVVVAMMVEERKASDNYHEDITTIGSGKAYIFQNGGVVVGSWQKNSVGEQLKFFDEAGSEVALAPGQTFVEAVPNYGSVEY